MVHEYSLDGPLQSFQYLWIRNLSWHAPQDIY